MVGSLRLLAYPPDVGWPNFRAQKTAPRETQWSAAKMIRDHVFATLSAVTAVADLERHLLPALIGIIVSLDVETDMDW